MKVYEGDDKPDRFGKHPIRFSGFRSLEEIHYYLFAHYQGYKFAVLFDETKDEYEAYGKEALVYFLDDILDEAAMYADMKVVKDDRTGGFEKA